ncbi:hypothetical protein Cgig2_013268 [Carnegiea gigantea]|uniref:Uncharacterized protein n=1 Tax=Carnegiea gigantea TaxID=171969 RepID=A0A9Q1K3S8_9CARY|nr:hypothetical protein Cgig2_013268 [Carnegiea gigantea]
MLLNIVVAIESANAFPLLHKYRLLTRHCCSDRSGYQELTVAVAVVNLSVALAIVVAVGQSPRFDRFVLNSVSLEREPTVDELYRDTHMRRKKDNQGNWVCKKSELRLDEHLKRWHEYRSSHTSTEDSSQTPPLSEQDIWVKGNLTSKGRVYGFGAEGVLMKQRSRLSASTHSSSVHNYDAREMAMRLNEGVVQAAEEARQAEEANHKEIEDLLQELAQEKATRQRDKDKVKSKLSKLWRFFKSQQAGSSTAPPQDDDEDKHDPSHLGDSSED